MRASLTFPAGLLFLSSFCQDGTLDVTFGTSGLTTTNVATYTLLPKNDVAEDLVQLGNGNYVVGGWYRSGPGGNGWDWFLTGYTPDGELNTAFGDQGKVRVINYYQSRSYGLATDQLGTYVLQGGYIDQFETFQAPAIGKFLATGALDSTFAVNGLVVDTAAGIGSVQDIEILPDGSFITVGRGQEFYAACAKYLPNGVRDSSFGIDSIPGLTTLPDPSVYYDAAIDADGSIVAVGSRVFEGGSYVLVGRYNSLGVLDTTFGDLGTVLFDVSTSANYSNAYAVALDASDRIVIAGATNNDQRSFLMRLLSDGSLDSTFADLGYFVDSVPFQSVANDVLIQPDCRIVTVGSIAQDASHIVSRFLPNGALDESFRSVGYANDTIPPAMGAGWRSLIMAGDDLVLAGQGGGQGTGTDVLIGKYHSSNDFGTDCVLNTVGIPSDTSALSHDLLAYPNPSGGLLQITRRSTVGEDPVELIMRDLGGRPVVRQNWIGQRLQVLDLRTCADGVYTLEATYRNGPPTVIKVVINR